ncbi:Fur-regulated basic protein FbpA [Bacillus manliponensis]|uniref:Histidine kinase n=1 Tax=Bacillus manliponensis TaxID=574376 RepID=A0A073KED9_9BACI|nr:Fur-regulated basic protein FbpA [Bacillus manliponensis]KEK20688.1 histidine kinase [Bacillus manliponensis]
MGNRLRFAVEERKKQLIDKLIRAGIYKVPGKQLYELSLSELERELENIKECVKA